ncbi:DEAD/DEAH box helicase [Campylobacter sp.]|uniref:DEAD/DEAH box helicase n=1 Tax=Campylobacter sp. TaxID=205 RepID=UPI0025C5FD97|nr:DEAD/DEAH box helicase [Campylobacter sp.]
MQARLYEYLQDTQIELIICEDDKEADDLAQVCLYLEFKTYVLPDFRAYFGSDLRSFSKELFEICKVLSAYHKQTQKKILISPIRTILQKLPGKNNLQNIILKKNSLIRLEKFKEEILYSGYEFVDIIQDKGEISIRGEIIDIFAINEEQPFRILLFSDEIESIRYFDINSQKSIPQELSSIEICPFLSNLNKDQYEKLQEKIKNFQSQSIVNDINSLGFWCIDDFYDYLNLNFISTKKFDNEDFEESVSKINQYILPQAKHCKDLLSTYNQDFFSFHKDKNILILAKNEVLFKALNVEYSQNITLKLCDIRLNLITKEKLIISLNKKQKNKRIRKVNLVIDELRIGDYIVHEDYGIAKFLGLEIIVIAGAKKEFVALGYLNNDKLLLPVENLYMIDKYIGASGSIPLLDKLGKGTFLKLKEKLKEKLFIIASNIVSLAATRSLIKAKKICIADELQDEFVNSAGFIYTKDQEQVCKEISQDLQSFKVMDRLLSGDVGFGKTEVAMNAIFSCIKSGYTALFFVPTTLLSSQHFKTLKQRFTRFNISVLKLDRFTSSKEKKQILEFLKEKKPCVVVGTHSLLNIECENLGLVVIDEEHKFGVKQKEKLKELSKNSHILSMSATPIPRSLNQALSSLKSYSILQTPPEDRLDVRTFVRESSNALIKEAISRELRRAGQIFYIHNHIASINESKEYLLELFPYLKILILHSKIDAKTTEEEMLKFENKEYDLLLCTSIVESGIDLPNANTIIVENSDRFGMADLHQLRGRVGRSAIQGYCYFLIEDKEKITKDSLKRLTSLESNSYLGSGSVLAYHDLEIRGGGNLLGVDQSGHIEQIGYSLYLKMLEDEINKLSKNETIKEKKIELKLNVNAFINSEYINEDRLRLELYRRLSKCVSVSEILEIESEMIDRFGKLDLYTKQFLDLITIKILASNDYKLISNFEQNICFVKDDENKEIIKAKSKDDDDILDAVLTHLRSVKL